MFVFADNAKGKGVFTFVVYFKRILHYLCVKGNPFINWPGQLIGYLSKNVYRSGKKQTAAKYQRIPEELVDILPV